MSKVYDYYHNDDEEDIQSFADLLDEQLQKIPGARLWDVNEDKPYTYFVELKIFGKAEIDKAHELIKKCHFEIVDEHEEENNTEYAAYLIFIKEIKRK